MWNVTLTEISFVDSNSFDASKINMNVKVTIIVKLGPVEIIDCVVTVFLEMHGHTI
jgi:hypothetical protein